MEGGGEEKGGAESKPRMKQKERQPEFLLMTGASRPCRLSVRRWLSNLVEFVLVSGTVL